MSLRSLLTLLLAWSLPTSIASAGGEDPPDLEAAAADPQRTLSPYFFVEEGSEAVEAFPLESTRVKATVSGVIAEVTVEQTYRNDGLVPINARYVFPASTRAAVHGMQIQVGNRRVVAKIKEREQAAAEFEQAKAQGKTASLLEQDRPNVFTMGVANIMPSDRVIVELRYSELLVPTDGLYSFVYPTVVGPRYAGVPAAGAAATDRFVATPYLPKGDGLPTSYAIDVALSTGVPLQAVYCDSHAVDVKWADKNLAQVSLVQGKRFAGNRDFILQYVLAGAQIQSGLLLHEHEREGENHFLLMVQPPERVEAAQIPPREYVFLLDVSGSMYGFPLDTAKALLTDLVSHLRSTDSFNVVLFSGDARLLAPSSLPATSANVQRAIEVISGERGGGGTELQAALGTALALPRQQHVSRTVVIMTDGYIAHERGAMELIAQNLHTTNVFAFGIGSSVNRHLIEGVARTGQGEPFVVTDEAQAGPAAARFRRYIESPVLTNVAVRLHGFDAYDIEPLQQPDLFAERPIVVLGKWRGERKGQIEVVGRGATAPFSKSIDATSVPVLAENGALPQLWARSRIARLSDFDVDGTDGDSARDVTALGLRYSLLTKHTSFIAVIEQIRNPGGRAAAVDQPLPLPQGVSELAVGGDSGGEYASGDEPELALLLGLLLAGYAWVATRRSHAFARSRT